MGRSGRAARVQIEAQQTAALGFVVGNVKSGKHCLGQRHHTPNRKSETDDKAPAEQPAGGFGKAVNLADDAFIFAFLGIVGGVIVEIIGLGWQPEANPPTCCSIAVGSAVQPVKRVQCREPGEDGKQHIEGAARRDY
jgi:hypothetical protein